MSRIPLHSLSAEHQNYIRRAMRESERKKKPGSSKPIWKGITFDSKAEIKIAELLEALRIGGRIESWMYHPIRVQLAPGCTYTPDFSAIVNGQFVLFEVKGSWKAKNARDSRTRLTIAAKMFPWWIWVDVTEDRSGHVFKVVGPWGQDPVGIGFVNVEASILRLRGSVRSRRDREQDQDEERASA